MTELELQEITKRGHVKVKRGPMPEGSPAPSVAQKHGVKGIIRQSKRQMNATEIRFETDYLKPMKFTGEIQKYRFESIRVKLGNGHWYKADFQAMNAAGRLCFFEVKGGRPKQREAGIGNIKTAANQYPEFEFWLCVWKESEWLNQQVLP